MTAATGKPAWRASLRAARAAVPEPVRSAEARALASWVAGLSGTVCAYHPVGTEPGSVLMLEALLAAGCRVLLPVVTPGGAALDWARYSGTGLAVGPYGLLEPIGPRLGAAAVSAAGTVLVPALAVDQHGVRLGRGGGYYDRSLVLAAGDAALVAVVRDAEMVPELPAEPHDILMTAALTPSAGFTPLGRTPGGAGSNGSPCPSVLSAWRLR